MASSVSVGSSSRSSSAVGSTRRSKIFCDAIDSFGRKSSSSSLRANTPPPRAESSCRRWAVSMARWRAVR